MTCRSLSVNLAALVAFALSVVLMSLAFPPPARMASFSPEKAMESLNSKTRKIRNAFCPSIRMGLFSRSVVFYEKPNKMTFISGSALRDEVLIACDGSEYWFWMRSFDKGSLYFCSLDGLDKTPVIPLMRPEVVRCMVWIDEIEGDIEPTARGFRAESKRGRFKKLVEFDSEKVLGQEIFFDGEPVVSLRALEFGRFSGLTLPTKVEAEWHEEKTSGVFTLEGWAVNIRTPEISKPKGLHRIDLEKF